ncbi:hypothetical protein PPL_10399 [Heterostelium album PN500]|uniref:DUF885 domain-containing protein n=1 Tax=Heterostelium pallidum (strain ATCC 26659 / Pp 5 / PN500) TaxID=670386 RepID=D3BQZ6_HETP5|nr:hypothetical protein PPL_10399 [Heterostelium album PN500]EFA76182.1 hypothetical protein PPL_10399 [Heterostelium album PN500]|eukprot:XP_020428315.1 hypothetical protein PPL_10399 [Heterostelium album PN500]
MTPREIHELGLKEVERIKCEIRELLQSEYPEINNDKTFGGTLRKICSEPRFQFPTDEEGRNIILREYTKTLRDVEKKLSNSFEKIPEAQLVVERVQHYREENAPMAHYHPAPLDRSRKGTCFINLRDTSTHNKINYKALAYHEGTPGHHFQISVAQVRQDKIKLNYCLELKGVDIFRRLLVFNAYAEGWALYVERLADELGWYENKYEKLGFLCYELWRACRLVLDTGIHGSEYRWTREEAIEYLLANSDKNEPDVIAEVERYVVIPGQACSYKIGQLKIIELREKAQKQLGSKYSLKEFHSAVLNSGALPLTIFENVIDEWIEKRKQQP